MPRTKRASDGTTTKCPACGKAVRGEKGLKAHNQVCEAQTEPKKD